MSEQSANTHGSKEAMTGIVKHESVSEHGMSVLSAEQVTKKLQENFEFGCAAEREKIVTWLGSRWLRVNGCGIDSCDYRESDGTGGLLARRIRNGEHNTRKGETPQ
jgi:hypothetical protein